MHINEQKWSKLTNSTDKKKKENLLHGSVRV